MQPIAAGIILVDDYLVGNAIDFDNSSILYEAEDRHLGMPVLIREFVPPNAVRRSDDGSLELNVEATDTQATEGIERFIREARALVRFHHPNIIRAHRVIEANGTAYIILDFEKATTLRTWLDGLGRSPTQAELDRLTGRLLEALGVVHSAGVLHRDIQPDNILVRSDLSPVLTGFANAAISDTNKSTGNTETWADTKYQAPEVAIHQGSGPPALSSDIYSLAATLYDAITGAPPPGASNRLLNDKLVPAGELANADYRESFLAVIDAALALPPGDRPQSVPDWLQVDTPVDPALAPPRPQSTQVRTPPNEPKDQIPIAGGQALDTSNQTMVQRFATHLVTTLDSLPDPGDYAPVLFARIYLPLAIVCAFAGLSLFGAGWNIPVSAILQVVAIVLLMTGGIFELYRFNIHLRHLAPADIATHTAEITAKTAVLASAILGLLAIIPMLASSHQSGNSDTPVETLSFIIGVPATGLLAVAVSTATITGFGRWIFGIVNLVVLVFCLFLLGLYVYVLAIQNVSNFGAVPLANTYLFLFAPSCAAILCVAILVTRLHAVRAMKPGNAQKSA